MLGIAKTLVRTLPSSVTRRARGTVIQRLYDYIRFKTTPLESYTFQTPVGEIALDVPADEAFGGKYSNLEHGHEPLLVDELAEVFSESSVYFNVGGQFGYTTVVAEAMGVAPSNIYVFEGNTFRSRVLASNCSDEVTIVPEFVGKDENKFISIDGFVDEHPTPDVVKIDVEGMEFDVLQGMTKTLRHDSPTLYVEVHNRFLPEYGASPEDLFRFLEKYGYTLAKVNHRAKGEQFVDVDEPLEHSSYLLKAVPE